MAPPYVPHPKTCPMVWPHSIQPRAWMMTHLVQQTPPWIPPRSPRLRPTACPSATPTLPYLSPPPSLHTIMSTSPHLCLMHSCHASHPLSPGTSSIPMRPKMQKGSISHTCRHPHVNVWQGAPPYISGLEGDYKWLWQTGNSKTKMLLYNNQTIAYPLHSATN